MSSGLFVNDERYIIRNHSSISVDYLEIIPYPEHMIISWNMIMSTQKLLTDILDEDFHDLLYTINLVRVEKNTEVLTLYIKGSSGIIELPSLLNGRYHCELVAHNSQNETITIRKSKSIFISGNERESGNGMWKVISESNKNTWLTAFSGYTVYE
ncbi:MAG TPA: hypothetical protein VEY70_25820 [Metabacillus sp.]|nr:hypothetical protein [Metabacillus sp.]